MIQKQLRIIYLGCSGFPFGLAEIERQKLISKSLVLAGAEVTVINRKGTHTNEDIRPSGTHEGIKYIYTSGSALRPQSFLKRNYAKLIGVINEWRFIHSENRKNKIDAAIVSSMYIFQLLYYRLISKLLGFKIVLNYVEYSSAIKMPFKYQINNYLFDRFAVHLSDIVFPISDFLVSHVQRVSPNQPILKIPSICDFDKFRVAKKPIAEPYFLFCGAAHYWEVILFVIKSFNLIENNDFYLYLIISGKSNSKQKIFDEIEKSPKKMFIKTFSALSYPDLVNYYLNARGMLIPLRPTLQDMARFPHKVAEYTASGNPMVTTGYGEILNYFRDEENALIASAYDENEFSRKMKFIINNPVQANEIGSHGFDTGLRYFNYSAYGTKIIKLLTL